MAGFSTETRRTASIGTLNATRQWPSTDPFDLRAQTHEVLHEQRVPAIDVETVSYTHLTLPTTPYV